MPGDINTWLGLAKSLIDTLGLDKFIGAIAVIALVFAVIGHFWGNK